MSPKVLQPELLRGGVGCRPGANHTAATTTTTTTTANNNNNDNDTTTTTTTTTTAATTTTTTTNRKAGHQDVLGHELRGGGRRLAGRQPHGLRGALRRAGRQIQCKLQ